MNRIVSGKAHIGRVGYAILGYLFRFFTYLGDANRLRKQKYSTDDITILKDIPYANKKGRGYLLDLYQRKNCESIDPVIVVIHGGGLLYGYKELNRNSNMELARKGYTVIALSYPLAPKHSFYEILNACQEALTFVCQSGNKYHYDSSKLYLVGDSAGGLLAYHLALLNKRKDKSDFFSNEHTFPIHAIALISPMSHAAREDSLGIVSRNVIQKRDKALKCYSLLKDSRKLFSSETLVPMYIFTSDKDFIKQDAIELKKKNEEVQNDFCFDLYHSEDYPLNHVFPICYPKYKESQEVFSKIDQFFKKH